MKYKVPRNTLDNRIRDKNLVVSEHAEAAIQGLGAVSGHLGALQAETPEIIDAVYDRIANETAFDINAGRIVAKTMQKLEEIVTNGTKLEKVGVGNGIQSFQEVGMMGGDYKEVMDAVYRGKEVLKGKEASTNINVSATSATQNNYNVLSDEELQEEMKKRGIPSHLKTLIS